MESESANIEELSAIIQAVRDRVRARYPEPGGQADAGNGARSIRVPIADLRPLMHARDAAQSKIAAIGSVNPRAGGLVNRAIQAAKKTIARSLQWFVRDQIAFNRETVSAIESVIEALNEHNRALVSLATQAHEGIENMQDLGRKLLEEVRELKDIRSHWTELRADWDHKVATNEIYFLRSVADLQGAFQHRSTLMESNFREIVKAQHADYLGALDRTTIDIQKRLWVDFQKVRAEYGQMIHDELRIIRLRQQGAAPPVAVEKTAVAHPSPMQPSPLPDFDYTRFAFRFRGPEEHVRRTEEVYKPFFANCRNVLDIGCGRGEFLDLMREMGIAARGIDLGEESIAQCRDKGLNAEVADLFTYLGPDTNGEFDGIFASQLVEHLDPAKLPEMISALRRQSSAGRRACHRNAERGVSCNIRYLLLSRSDTHTPGPASIAGVLHGGSRLGADRDSRTLPGRGIDAGGGRITRAIPKTVLRWPRLRNHRA